MRLNEVLVYGFFLWCSGLLTAIAVIAYNPLGPALVVVLAFVSLALAAFGGFGFAKEETL